MHLRAVRYAPLGEYFLHLPLTAVYQDFAASVKDILKSILYWCKLLQIKFIMNKMHFFRKLPSLNLRNKIIHSTEDSIRPQIALVSDEYFDCVFWAILLDLVDPLF